MERPLQPPHQRQGGLILVDRSAQHDKIIPTGILVGAGVFDDEVFHKAEIGKPDAHQHDHRPPQGDGQDPVQHQKRRDQEQHIAPPGVAPHSKAQDERSPGQNAHQCRQVFAKVPQHDPGGDSAEDIGVIVQPGPEAQRKGQRHEYSRPDGPEMFFHLFSSSQRS